MTETRNSSKRPSQIVTSKHPSRILNSKPQSQTFNAKPPPQIFKAVTLVGGDKVTKGTRQIFQAYNEFHVHTHTRTFDKSTRTWLYKHEEDASLKGDSKLCLGLNKEWLKREPEEESGLGKERIRELHLKFPYWGHLIYTSIQEFNEKNKNSGRCRKLVYDLRHGEADHNALKKMMKAARKAYEENCRKLVYNLRRGKADNSALENLMKAAGKAHQDKCRKLADDLRHAESDQIALEKLMKAAGKANDEWTEDPEYKRIPSFTYLDGKNYDTVDPPLTSNGKAQAKSAGMRLLRLKEHKFPMPKSAYVSPLYRAMQTFMYAFVNVGLPGEQATTILHPEEATILFGLRERQTGNCADILSDEFADKKKTPPTACPKVKGVSPEWLENDKGVMVRAKAVHEQIFEMDDSDCVARVTHSLLIRYNLMNLAANNQEVMQTFMLDEGGLIAYVIEGKKATKNPETLRESMMKQPKPEDFTARLRKVEEVRRTSLRRRLDQIRLSQAECRAQ